MALINKASPIDTDQIAGGDDQFRALKDAIEQIVGIADNVNIATAAFSIAASGLQYALFQNVGAPVGAGRLQRNGANLMYHDGTAARNILTDLNGACPFAGALAGSSAGDYTTTSSTYVEVDSTNLKASITLPTGVKQLVVLAHCQALHTGVTVAGKTLVLDVNGGQTSECGNFTTGITVSVPFFLVGLYPAPSSGVKNISLKFRANSGVGTTIIRNGPTEDATSIPRMFYAALM